MSEPNYLNPTAQDVAEYVSSLRNDRTVAVPVSVKIGRTTYIGAEYRETRDHHIGTRAYREALATGGPMTYELHALYLLGDLPASYVNRHARVYEDASDDGTRWHVGSWFNPASFVSVSHVREADGSTRPTTLADVAHYHPFGAHFLVMACGGYEVTNDDGSELAPSRIKPIDITGHPERLSAYLARHLILPDGTEHEGRLQLDDAGAPIVRMTTCGTCGFAWNDALITGLTPTPSGRCPNEYGHPEDTSEDDCTEHGFDECPDCGNGGIVIGANGYEHCTRFHSCWGSSLADLECESFAVDAEIPPEFNDPRELIDAPDQDSSEHEMYPAREDGKG